MTSPPEESNSSAQPPAGGGAPGGVVGVLALQGAVAPHLAALAELGVDPVEVRTTEALAAVDRLVIPGGESTTLDHLLRTEGLREPLRQRALDRSLALFGTCAGAILLGRDREDERPRRLGVVDVTVDRNAYGRQMDSFIGPIEAEGALGAEPLEGVFIRAPRFRDAGEGIEVLARRGGEAVALRQARTILCTFHPELSSDRRLHRLFLDL
ncbi:MAG: pyridoxal 5'-phosphate synthase glutaminase subunit PdxT [Planctomycetota bacterium]|jgi:5'-phosphate synthase pdxT subunit